MLRCGNRVSKWGGEEGASVIPDHGSPTGHDVSKVINFPRKREDETYALVG